MQFTAEDQLLWDAEAYLPGGQLQLLAHEIDSGLNAYGARSKFKRSAQLKVWIGRFRYYQASHDQEAELNAELQALSHRVFHQLKWLSRQYEPGYIEAFRQDFSTDWAAYVAEAQEQLHQAIDSYRRKVGPDHYLDSEIASESILPESSRMFSGVLGSMTTPAFREALTPSATQLQSATPSLEGLKALVTRIRLPDDGLDQFLAALREAVNDVGTANPELLRLVLPYCEHISGEEAFIALRRNLERIQLQNPEEQSCDVR